MNRFWNDLSYQSKLLLCFFLLGIIPSVSIGAIAYFHSVNTLEARVNQDLSVIVGQLNAAIERQVEDVDRFSTFPYFTPDIFRLLNQPYVPREQWGYQELETQQEFAKLLITYPSIFSTIQGLVFYGSNGNIFGYRVSERSSINDAFHPGDEGWYKETIRRNGGIYLSGIREERQFNAASFPTITASRVLVDEDFRSVGVLAVDIRPDFIESIVQSFRLKHMSVAVADQYGELVYATHPADGERVAGALAGRDGESAARRGTLEVSGLEEGSGVARGVYARSDYLGWTSFLLIDRQELLKEAYAIRNYTVLAVVFFAAASALVSLVLARGLSRPIRSLIRSMREVERGVFSAPAAEYGKGEIGLLHQSYVRMVGRLDLLVRSIEEKEKQKREAELYALRARIAPHFLYNTINSIRMLAVLQQSDRIAKLLHALNKLLHANMKLDREQVPLEAELDLLRSYLKLMELRYTNRFRVEWRIEPGTETASVPPMILQPIAENAIFHGALGVEQELTIEVGAKTVENGSELLLWIEDNGQGVDPGTIERLSSSSSETPESDGASIGVANVRDRIRLRYGLPYTLSVEPRPGGGTRAVFRLPRRIEETEGDA